MKLELQLFGVNVSASPAGVTLLINGSQVRFSRAEFAAIVHALSSIQGLLERIPAPDSAASPRAPAASGPAAVVSAAVVAAAPGAKKRGRPPKGSGIAFVPAAVSAAPAAAAVVLSPSGKKRGRPPKGSGIVFAPPAPPVAAVAISPNGKKRGRPPKGSGIVFAAPVPAPVAEVAVSPSGKKRGRPPQGWQTAVAAAAPPAGAAASSGKLRGRPRKSSGAPASAAASSGAAESTDGGKRGPGRPRTDGTPVGAPRLVELVDAWMAKNPGPKSVAELAEAATANGWVEPAQATELLERHVPRAPQLFVRMPDGRFRRRADKTPVEAPKAAKVLRRRGHDQVAIVRVEAPGT